MTTLSGCRLEPPAPLGATRVEGTVSGPDGSYLSGVPVAVRKIDPETGQITHSDQTWTDERGRFSVDLWEPGPVRFETSFPGCRPAAIDVEAGLDGDRKEVTIALLPAAGRALHGMLVGSDGLPFDPSDLALLFPDRVGHDELVASPGADGIDEIFPFTGDSGVVIRYRVGRAAASVLADVDPNSGRFEAELPVGAVGEATLRFRGSAVASDGFTSDDSVVELWTDIRKLRAGLGTLDLDLPDAARGAVTLQVARFPADRPGPAGQIALRGVPTKLRLVGIPAGRYGIVATGTGAAQREVTVSAGRSTRERVELAATGSLVLTIDGGLAPGLVPDLPETLEVRTRSGQLVPFTTNPVADPAGTITLDGLPAGEVVVSGAANAQVFPVVAGAATPAPFTLRPVFRHELNFSRVDAYPTRSLNAIVTLSTRDGIFLRREVMVIPPGPRLVAALFQPAGRFLVTAELEPGWVHQEEVVLRERDESITIDLTP